MSNIFSFFGQEVKTGTPQTFEIPFGEVVLHISTIALAKDTPKGAITRVFVHAQDDEAEEEGKDNKFVVCTLVGKEKESITVDLNFSEDVAFSLETTAGEDTTVHLTGYINLVGDEEEGEYGGYSFLDDADEVESDDEEKSKILRKMLEEDEDDEDDEDFKPDLNESTESATKIEDLSDEDEIDPKLVPEDEDEEEIDDEVAKEVMTKVEALEEKLGREAKDEEIQHILESVQKAHAKQEEKKHAAPAKKEQPKKEQPKKEQPKKEDKKEQPKKEDKKEQPKKEDQSKKRKQEEALGNNNNNNNNKKNKKNKKKK